eukprot:gene12691-6585_t
MTSRCFFLVLAAIFAFSSSRMAYPTFYRHHLKNDVVLKHNSRMPTWYKFDKTRSLHFTVTKGHSLDLLFCQNPKPKAKCYFIALNEYNQSGIWFGRGRIDHKKRVHSGVNFRFIRNSKVKHTKRFWLKFTPSGRIQIGSGNSESYFLNTGLYHNIKVNSVAFSKSSSAPTIHITDVYQKGKDICYILDMRRTRFFLRFINTPAGRVKKIGCKPGYVMAGIKRGRNDSLLGIIMLKCCKSNIYPPKTKLVTEWRLTLDVAGWSLVPKGYIVQSILKQHDGLHGCVGAYSVRGIKEGKCYDLNTKHILDAPGWASCKAGYAISGFYRNSGLKWIYWIIPIWENGLHNLEHFKCCEY